MPTKTNKSLKTDVKAFDISNAIRNSASVEYRSIVPPANPTNVKEIGAILLQYPGLMNEYLNAVNRLAMVRVMSRLYRSKLRMFKIGSPQFEYGETIEDLFVDLAKPFQYDTITAESEVEKRQLPNILANFFIMNYQKFYKVTIEEKTLRKAFLSWNGVSEMISNIIGSMYSAMEYDEELVIKYMLARWILDGKISVVPIATITTENMRTNASFIRGSVLDFTDMLVNHNTLQVETFTPIEDQYLITTNQFSATMDVEVLATSFNMEKAEFLGHQVHIPSLGKLNITRLNDLLGDNPGYEEISDDELKELDQKVPAILCDRRFIICADNLTTARERENEQGLYRNHFLHAWRTFGLSPVANAVAFVAGTPSVTSVTVEPASVPSAKVNTTIQLSANVVTTDFAPQTVEWSVTSGTGATVSNTGLVTLSGQATGTIKIRATSAYDTTKYGECTITIS